VARPYEEVVDTSYMQASPELKKFADALVQEAQAEYESIFGLGQIVDEQSD